jgi:hypothetical protein
MLFHRIFFFRLLRVAVVGKMKRKSSAGVGGSIELEMLSLAQGAS